MNQYTDTSNMFVVGMDPGNNTGTAIFEVDPITLKIINICTSVSNLDSHQYSSDIVQINRNLLLRNVCENISGVYNPNVLAIETSFLNRFRPLAVIQLSQYVSTIERTFHFNNNFINIYKYAPRYVKKYIGAGGNADKLQVLKAVNNISEISSNIALYAISEHEIDAIAIGYLALKYTRKYHHTLIGY